MEKIIQQSQKDKDDLQKQLFEVKQLNNTLSQKLKTSSDTQVQEQLKRHRDEIDKLNSRLEQSSEEVGQEIKKVKRVKDPAKVPSIQELREKRKHFVDLKEAEQEIGRLKKELKNVNKLKSTKQKDDTVINTVTSSNNKPPPPPPGKGKVKKTIIKEKDQEKRNDSADTIAYPEPQEQVVEEKQKPRPRPSSRPPSSTVPKPSSKPQAKPKPSSKPPEAPRPSSKRAISLPQVLLPIKNSDDDDDGAVALEDIVPPTKKNKR